MTSERFDAEAGGNGRGGGERQDRRSGNASTTMTLSVGEKRREIERVKKSLPIYAAKSRLMEEIRKAETIIIIGETGSGKTTQIPQYIYEDFTLSNGLMIGVTQPRRVAAISVSHRVADETGTEHGTLVGYAIRFEDVSSPETRIKFLTDGMLLREAVVDPTLAKYGVIMIDEAHERTLQTDFLLGTIKIVQQTRRDSSLNLPPLRVVVMSATLEASSFSKFFDNAPVVYSHGRTFPVDMFYTEEPEEDYVDAAMWTCLQINAEETPGDILVFLTGQEEIEALGKMLKDRAAKLPPNLPKLNVVLLFAALPPEEQMKVFEETPPGTRKVVLATNIAETSLTINGIRYVVDSGLTKSRTYHPRSGVDELMVAPIAQSQAMQRAGRAGREAPGKCFRLYTEEVMPSLPKFIKPELLRTNLSGVVLQLKVRSISMRLKLLLFTRQINF
jgi:ATP-dependent RNA helicase DHX8/PRP22